MLVLTDADVLAAMSMAEAIDVVERAFAHAGTGRARNLPRRRAELGGRTLHVLGGAMAQPGYFATKTYMSAPGGGSSWLLLFDADGAALAAIEAVELSRLRTGAATAVATRWLSRRDSRTLAIIGSGRQAAHQVAAVLRVREIDQVRAWSPTRTNVKRFAEAMQTQVRVPVAVAADGEEAVHDADVVVLMTTAATPVFRRSWLRAGMHLNLVGCNRPRCSEVESGVVAASDVLVVDDLAQARREAGDFLAAIDAGDLAWTDVIELSDVVTQRRRGRADADQITLFNSLGIGIEDVAVAAAAYEQARSSGLGTVI